MHTNLLLLSVCTNFADLTDEKKFIQMAPSGNVSMHCPLGTAFVAADCGCTKLVDILPSSNLDGKSSLIRTAYRQLGILNFPAGIFRPHLLPFWLPSSIRPSTMNCQCTQNGSKCELEIFRLTAANKSEFEVRLYFFPNR